MEIDITSFFNNEDPAEFSASRAELGDDAGRITWGYALSRADTDPILTAPAQIDALRSYVKGFGAWDDEEIANWTEAECNAMFIQLISGDMRQIENLCMADNGDVDWNKHEELAQQGQLAGNIFQGSNGRIYYYLGC